MRLICDLTKALEIKASMVFHVAFVKKTILSCLFFFLFIINLNFLVPTFITQIFDPTAEFAMPIGILSKEAKVEIKTHSVIADTKIGKYSHSKPFCVYNVLIHFGFFGSLK